jgi:thymidylate synthase (FAD)
MSEIAVLDHGSIRLIETWGSDEAIIEAARMSTGKGFLGWGTREAPGDEKLLAYLWNHRHTSPFEQAGLRVAVQAPIFVFREWHRHRTQSFNEFSARYAPMPDLHYVPTLERVKIAGGNNKQAGGVVGLAPDDRITQWLTDAAELQAVVYRHYEHGLELGIPKEVARINTPVARYSKMVASANLLNWLRFLGLRMAPVAQWEIRQYAEALGAFVAEHFPRTWTLFRDRPI